MLLSLLALAPARALPAQANPQSRDLEVLRQLEEQYLRAEVEDDTVIAGTILADDYVGLRGDGSTSTKSDVLSRLARHERMAPHHCAAASGRCGRRRLCQHQASPIRLHVANRVYRHSCGWRRYRCVACLEFQA